MVNPNSPTFKLSEKLGLILGKGIRYMFVGGIIVLLSNKLSRSNSVPNPPVRY